MEHLTEKQVLTIKTALLYSLSMLTEMSKLDGENEGDYKSVLEDIAETYKAIQHKITTNPVVMTFYRN